MVNFFRTIATSVWSPSFYAAIAAVSLGRALRYFLALALLLVAIRLVPFIVGGVVLLPLVTTGLADLYPPDLELRVTKGVVTTNVTEPYFIPMPEYVALADGPRYFAVIVT